VRTALAGGIIAAGEGSRLRQAGFAMPKPMVPIAGVPLIESVIRNLTAARVAPLAIIVNEDEQPCVDWVRGRFPELDIDFIVKTTPSSLASFGEVIARHPGGRMLVSTVDAWCIEADVVRFVDAAARRPLDATVLAVTPLIADEKPLRVAVGAGGRVTDIGGEAGDLVTAGMYLVPERVRGLRLPAALRQSISAPRPTAPELRDDLQRAHPRLRDFLRWLVRSGEPVYAEIIEQVIDVDRAEDVALAETLALAGRVS
jgi:NDP-sugar pyrophosphorylase family protein